VWQARSDDIGTGLRENGTNKQQQHERAVVAKMKDAKSIGALFVFPTRGLQGGGNFFFWMANFVVKIDFPKTAIIGEQALHAQAQAM
jgi:hypothetical protein